MKFKTMSITYFGLQHQVYFSFMSRRMRRGEMETGV